MSENLIEKKEVNFCTKDLLSIFISGFVLSLIHNYLLYGFLNGPGEFIFSMLFIINIFLLSLFLKIKLYKDFYITAIILIIFSFFKMIRVGEFLNLLNNISIFFLYLYLIKIIIKDKFINIKASDYFPGFIKTFFGVFSGLGIYIRSILKVGIKIPSFENKKHIIKGVLMSLPLIFIFTMLFSSADLVFKNIVSNLFNWNFTDISGRLINIIILFLIFIGFTTYIIFQKSSSKEESEKEFIFENNKHIEIYIVLGTVAILFLIFVFLQIGYLFSGENYIISQGFTYSEYARKGFVELAISAVIIFILLWKIDKYLYGHKKTTSNLYKTLSSFLIFLTILILFSALYRLWLYENAYGFTEMRFYGYLFIIILFLSLITTLYKILFFIEEGIFISINIYFYLFGLIFANIFNPEYFVSEHNLNKNYKRSLSVDFNYIGGRSSDAIDSVLVSYEKLSDNEKLNMDYQFCRLIEKIKSRKNDWRNYNYSYNHTYKILLPLKGKLNCKKMY